ncbi:MAG: hypothetical protein ACRCZY_11865 [Phocaeicola sp.]
MIRNFKLVYFLGAILTALMVLSSCSKDEEPIVPVKEYTISFVSENKNLGTVDNPGGTGDFGDIFKSTATANENCTFVGWYVGSDPVVAGDDITITGNTLKVKLSEATGGKTYTANFEQAVALPEFSFTIKTTSANPGYTIPFVTSEKTGDYQLTVDWGDGTEIQTIPAGTPLASKISHTYAVAKEYTITITSSERDYAKAQMPKASWTDDNLLKSINTPLLNIKATDFSYAFSRCTSLTTIPEGLFANNTAATNFSCVFNGCTSLTTIPVELFKYNTAATNFSKAFDECTSLTTIPEGLFANNTAATVFTLVFNECTSLTTIPEGLFAKNTAAIDFSLVFNCCTSLTTIPEGLFANNTAATNFSCVFNGCTSLTTIPAGLFAKNTAVTDFSIAFNNCSSLTFIPGGLFANNTAATNFGRVFDGCTKAKVDPNIFCDEKTETNSRFNSVTGKINFFGAFRNVGSQLSDVSGSTFPTLWSYAMPSAGFTSAYCFTSAKASNTSAVDAGWR